MSGVEEKTQFSVALGRGGGRPSKILAGFSFAAHFALELRGSIHFYLPDNGHDTIEV